MDLAPGPKLSVHVKLWTGWGRSDRTGVLTIRERKAGVGCGGAAPVGRTEAGGSKMRALL